MTIASRPAIVGVAWLSLGLTIASCSGGTKGDGATAGDGTIAGPIACAADSECAAQLPATEPAGCATATCNALQNVCEFTANDKDGDGHATASCKSKTDVQVIAGDDCNDADPDLYPGHPEPCSMAADAGTSGAIDCTKGKISCLTDGTASRCVGTVSTCTGSTAVCLDGACVACNPGNVECNGQQPQNCDAIGTWRSNGAPCATQACVNGACNGVCSPSTTQCSGNSAVQTCGSNGQWGVAVQCNDQACVSGACAGACTPGFLDCRGSGPQKCDLNGQWQSNGAICRGATPVCANGGCATDLPSCAPGGPGMSNCGVASESCCTSSRVQFGTYDRTYTNTGSGPTGVADPATLSSFLLEKYLVTVGRFRQFVNAWSGGAGWLPPPGAGKHTILNFGKGLANSSDPGTYESGWVASDNGNVAPTDANLACDPNYATWTPSQGSNENLPMNCVNWYEAYAFCIWDSGFLPSEAEWEYAAAGGSQQLEYPWGTAPPGTANQYAIYGNNATNTCYYPSVGPCTGVKNIAPVGTATLGVGAYGQLDMAGSVEEWTLDTSAKYVSPCSDCAYLTPAANRVLRGGSYAFNVANLVSAGRGFITPPKGRSSYYGLRCARSTP